MTAPSVPSELEQECRVFSRYLAGVDPTVCQREAYLRGHRSMPLARVPPEALDGLLVAVARRGAGWARLADAYARRTRPVGLLRQKLVLQLAILESSPPSHRWVGGADAGSGWVVALRAAWAVGISIACLAAAVVIFGPAHMAVGWWPGREAS